MFSFFPSFSLDKKLPSQSLTLKGPGGGIQHRLKKQRRRGYGKVADHQDIVHQLYIDNDELSAVDVQRILRDDHGIVASLATVSHVGRGLGGPGVAQNTATSWNLSIRKRGCFSAVTWWMPKGPCSTTLMTVYSPTNVQSSYFGAVPQTHRETPHKGARVGRDFGQRSNKGTCVRRTNGHKILFRYHIDKRLHPIRPESVPRSA